MIRCNECGHENMDGLEYCDGCGGKLPTTTSTPAPASDSAPIAGEATEAASSTDVSVEPTPDVPVTVIEQPSTAVAITSAKLTLVRGGTVGKVFTLQVGDNLVGRWDPDSGAFPEVDMENDDPEARISRKHALIKVSDHITIEDIGSLNGTFVNRGTRLEPGAPATLKDGDEIIVGKTFFRLSLS
jgi:pSer/pThr/pTyr-binding forkhead associated (FHA) protein